LGMKADQYFDKVITYKGKKMKVKL